MVGSTSFIGESIYLVYCGNSSTFTYSAMESALSSAFVQLTMDMPIPIPMIENDIDSIKDYLT